MWDKFRQRAVEEVTLFFPPFPPLPSPPHPINHPSSTCDALGEVSVADAYVCRWSRLLVPPVPPAPQSPSRLATHPTNPIRSVRLGPDVTVIYKYIHIQGTQTPDVVK